MERLYSLWLSIFLVLSITVGDAVDQDRQVHIVYMGGLPGGEYSPSSYDHVSMLQQVVPPRFVRQSLVRSYTRSFNAFAAYLTEQEREKLASFDGVLSVFPSRILHPQTTRSWDFMGLSEASSRSPTTESDVIVGHLDSGVWPESESFSDEGLGPVPSNGREFVRVEKTSLATSNEPFFPKVHYPRYWCTKVRSVWPLYKPRTSLTSTRCGGGYYTTTEHQHHQWTLNIKIIGARWYSLDGSFESARDTLGHGSHTASIVAGKNVKDASFYGFAQGTARGGVPSARIAAYRVCNDENGCYDPDILAAFDDAIADGVDIISISIGGVYVTPLYTDCISIGSFHAMERGILTVNSAGNDGTRRIHTSSIAPWMLTVAASNTDRRIINKLVLGNATTFVGNAINPFHLDGGNFSVIYGNDASSRCSGANASKCETGCLDSGLVRGKIVLCDEFRDGLIETPTVGALGAIVPSDEMDMSFVLPLPATGLSNRDMSSIRAYVKSTKNPKATILTSEVIRVVDAPLVAKFSSQGPNSILPEILKPDITAPGVEILAAYSPSASPSEFPSDKRFVKYNIISGTSMSCPHVAGAAAYVKSFHPDWSPSAIKSALMTSAWEMNAAKHEFAEFAYGAGHLDPVKAVNPGLVFVTTKDDYIKLVCILGYDPKLFGGNISCSKGINMKPKDLNYPSMAFEVGKTKPSFTVKFTRTVTNVGLANSTYKATIIRNNKLDITVKPDILWFDSVNEQKSFEVTVSGAAFKDKSFLESASLVWSDGSHRVRSPIVVF